jgi:hypothetical protein
MRWRDDISIKMSILVDFLFDFVELSCNMLVRRVVDGEEGVFKLRKRQLYDLFARG